MEKQKSKANNFAIGSKIKKYFLSAFLFVSVAIICNGLFVGKAYAEENVPITAVDSDITEDTTWGLSNNPYVVDGDIVVVEGVTLTIEPGVIVKFKSGSITVDGKIDAEGTESDPIYFTSNSDDVGGSTDDDTQNCYYESYEEDGVTPIGDQICDNVDVSPLEGDWENIFIESTTDQSILNNVIMRYSGGGLYLFQGASLSSDNLNSDSEVYVMSSSGTFNNLTVPAIDIQDESNVTIDNSVISSHDNFGAVTLFGDSSLQLKNSKIEGIGSFLLNIFDNSTATIDTVDISGEMGFGPLVGVFDNGSLDINNSNLKGNNDGIWVYENSNLNLSGGTISCLNDGLSLHDETKADITGVKISDAMDAGIIAYNNTDPNPITVTKSEITGNNYGFLVYSTNFSAHQNSIHDNLSNGAYTDIPNDDEGETPPVYNLDFASNYWGDPTGPNSSTSPDGLGDFISDGITYSPFLKSDPLIPTKNPVIIIPGVMGTQLIRDYGDKSEIWPDILRLLIPGPDSQLNDLSLLPSGEEDSNFPIKTGDIIRNISSKHIFDNLISDFTSNGYTEGEDLFVFPYDWRFSNTKNAELLKEKINQILNDTEKEKVDIVAHSMGGLLAKEYIKENGKDKINHLVFLGTPHLGAPKAMKALVYGDDMGISILLGLLGLNPERVKVISQNMPSTYELLPSSKYVSDLRYVSEKISGSDPTYFDYNQTKKFLEEEGINENLVQSADTFHQSIDDIDLSGINVSNISACGEPTLSAINISKKLIGKDYKLDYTNGDGTVPLDSSAGVSNVNRYFVDQVEHSALPSAEDVPDTVLNILGDKAIPSGSKVFEDVNKCTPIHGVILSIHSPITLDVYDRNGNHSGLDVNGDIENNIPGVSYDTIGEAKFAFIPDGVSVNVKGLATSSGSFDLAIEKVINGETKETKFWNDVPITSTSQMNFDFNSYDNINTIELDNNGVKTNIPSSNILTEGESYLNVPNIVLETKSHVMGGSSIINNSKNIVVKSDISLNTNMSQSKVNNVDIKKQKSLAVLKQKVVIPKQEKIQSTPLVSTSSVARHKLGIWVTIKLFFKWLLNIFK